MKRLFILASLVCFTMIYFSCSKKDTPDPLPPPPHVGFWKGKFSPSLDSAMNKDIAFLIRSNNTFRAYTLNQDTALAGKAEGTYSVSGSSFNGSYQYLSVSGFIFVRGDFNTPITVLAGTWGENATATNGNLNVAKQ